MEKPYESTHRSRLSISFPWVIALLGCLLLLVTNITPNVFGVFFKPIAQEFGWSRAEVSLAYAIRSMIMAILSMPMGYLSDRYGPRRVLLPSFILLAAGLMANALVESLWQFFLVQGVVIGVASAALFTSIISAVARWHDKRRGLALGITSMGIGLGGIIFPPLSVSLIEDIGWRWATVILGVIAFAVAVPASFIMRNPPSNDNGAVKQGGPLEVWRIVPRFLANGTFVAILLMFLFFYIACNVITSHLVNYVTDSGTSAIVAASMMSVMGIAGTLGRLVMGTFSDRIGVMKDALICYSLLAASLILINLNILPLIWVAVALFGIAFGGASPLVPAIMGERFGTEHLATLTGAATFGVCIGATIGPLLGGIVFDATQSYQLAMALAATLAIIPIVIALRLPKIKKGINPEKQLFD